MGRAGARSERAGAQACQTGTSPPRYEPGIGEGSQSSATGAGRWRPLARPEEAGANGEQDGRGAGGGEGGDRAEQADQRASHQRAQWGGEQEEGAAGRQHRGQVRAGRGGLEQGVGQRDERAIDQPAEGKARQRHAEGGEDEGQQAGPPARDDEERDPLDVPGAQGAGQQRRDERADAEGRPVGGKLTEGCFYQIWWIIHFPLSNAEIKDPRACDLCDEHMCAFRPSTTFGLFVPLLTK